MDFSIMPDESKLVLANASGVAVPDSYEDVLKMLPTLHRFGLNYNNFVANSVGCKSFALMNAAPEPSDKWGIALYPGLTDENGEVQRWTSGAEQSCFIFGNTNMPEDSWTFLSWWMSEETQTQIYNGQAASPAGYLPEGTFTTFGEDALKRPPSSFPTRATGIT